jgi:hypothetical protein
MSNRVHSDQPADIRDDARPLVERAHDRQGRVDVARTVVQYVASR